jgi:hypothetical protein
MELLNWATHTPLIATKISAVIARTRLMELLIGIAASFAGTGRLSIPAAFEICGD